MEFLSEGPEVIGNDYAIDDISFNKIQVPEFIPVKTVDRPSAAVGETVRFTVTLANTCQSPLTNLFFQDQVPDGLSFVPGTVTINGQINSGANPALNQAVIRYSYTPVAGGIPGIYLVTSNEVPVLMTEAADVAVVKTAAPGPVLPGSILTYTVNVSNRGPSPAENVLLTDVLPAALTGREFSVNGGSTPNPDLSNNSSTDNTEVTARLIPSSCGPCIIYKLTVCNARLETARQVVVTDELSPDICDPVCSADHGLTQCPWNGQFSVLELPAGDCVCIDLSEAAWDDRAESGDCNPF